MNTNHHAAHPAEVLVVDDEAAIRTTLEALLRRCSYHVSLAASGEQALTYLARHPVDLILLDLVLPGMSGLDVAICARALRPTTAILLLTGSDQLAKLEQNDFAYVEKTAPPQAVLDRIAALLAADPPILAAHPGGAPLPPWHTALLEGFTHDVRNMVTIIQGSAKLIAHHSVGTAPAARTIIADRVEAIHAAAHQINAQLAQLGHTVAGAPTHVQTNLVALARHIAAAHQLPGSPHHIHVKAERAQVLGAWDSASLARILDNLVGNAVKYSPSGRPIVIEIATSVEASGAWATVHVCDQGIGIPADALEKIFSPYYRAANIPPGSSGQGFGLTSVRRLVAAAGGTIEVQSQQGLGSRFTVRLPIRQLSPLAEREAVCVPMMS